MNEIKRGFKKKTINAIIENKIDDWIKTVNNEELKNNIKNNIVVTGGAIASMLLGENPNDFDIYFKSNEIAIDVANYYLEPYAKKTADNQKIKKVFAEPTPDGIRIVIKSAGVLTDTENVANYTYFEQESAETLDNYFKQYHLYQENSKNQYKPAYISDNAISLHGDIQLVFRFTGQSDKIHENFDFVHTKNYWTAQTGLVLNQDSLEAILTKELIYAGSKFPICSLFRIRKFIERGWTINAGEILKISYDISKLNLDDYETLRNQSIGVDTAYFAELLNVLKNDNKPINRTYLYEIINRVFGE